MNTNRPADLAPLTLRGHHLLCSLNYSGSGYSAAFVRNFDDLCQRLTAGEPVTLTWQPDTICQPVLDQPGSHCRAWRIPVRDFLGFLATSIALRRWFFPPRTVTLTAADVALLRRNFRHGTTRAACLGCEWFAHCSRTAHAGNPYSRLHPVSSDNS